MSSPSGRSEATRSQDSMHASSQQGADVAIEDTASSVAPRGLALTASHAHSPNATFVRGVAAARARSASPRLHDGRSRH